MEKVYVNNVDITDMITSFEVYEEMDNDLIIGNAVSTQIKIKLKNKDNQFEGLLDYPFVIGNKTYIVYEKPSRWTKTILLTLYDKMTLTNVLYVTELETPTTIENQLDEMSKITGVEIDKTTLSDELLERYVEWQDKTMVIRTYLGYIAQCDGKNAYIENDKIVFRKLGETLHEIDFCSNYEINELITFTRVYFDNGTVIYSNGNRSKHTLYLSPYNRYIQRSDIDHIFNMYDNFSFYSFKNFRCRKTQEIKLTHLIIYNGMMFMPTAIKTKINGGEANDSLDLSGDIKIKSAEDITINANPNEEIKKIVVDQVESTRAKFERVDADFIKVNEKLEANDAEFKKINANKLSAEDADLKYANIDFSNIDKAAMEYFYANSGLIKNVTIGDATITGELVGVTIKGDLVEGGTVVADKLVIKGTDGLYYKLNTDGITTEAEQTEYNSLNGQVIMVKSVTASKISVDDLVAFDATIGGFKITEKSIYSGVKETVDNTTKGIYMDNTGQIAFGDSNNFIKYFKDTDGLYKLEISAAVLKFGGKGTSIEEEINNLKDEITTVIAIESSRGTQFKNSSIATTLIAVVYRGSQRITDITALKEAMGDTASIRWNWKHFSDDEYIPISPDDPRIGSDGFTIALNPGDVDFGATFMCELIT